TQLQSDMEMRIAFFTRSLVKYGKIGNRGGVMKKIALTALLSSALTLCVAYSVSPAKEITRKVVLENARVQVTERIMPPGGVRSPYIRPSDQVIVFVSHATYERTDPKTGEKIIRERKAGHVIWHERGENAPKLVNVGKDPLRSLVIALK
ncbi:hypothetical protein MYX65_04780, partial [Acidobacteria bacterium AH-259-L09]|nr:hypothetical protein [Acidobacteria bacterium AH-259-L09]